ncbi:hypothetical protein [Pontimicrobium sp. SW4]|uniref:Polysaccharide chain length determinant N-terminal domain-containing protein n=1 Tax=Pontimicrobium sp. SW4 TaxID=3153519 RepID=A0AAU7BRP8_9FLAO
MSTNLPEQQPSEEVDLGQLFKLIGNAFERFFKFIGSIFNKLFLAFVWFVFFTKKHFLKLVIAGIIGVILGVVKQKIEDPVYKSTIVIKQNYDTGEHLFNTIEYYNSLIKQKDSIEVSKIFQIKPKQAADIIELEMESNLTDNEKLQLFDEYRQSLDSTLAITINYKDFLENTKDYNYNIQKLTLKSKSKTNFNPVLDTIISNIANSEFFKNEKEKKISDLNRRDEAINTSLKESKELQEVYKKVLDKPTEEQPRGTTTMISVGDSKEKSFTKEYELFSKDLELRMDLVENETNRKNLEDIIEIVSSQDGDGTRDNRTKLFGIETSWTISLSIKLILVSLLLLLLIEFVKYLERFKDKI